MTKERDPRLPDDYSGGSISIRYQSIPPIHDGLLISIDGEFSSWNYGALEKDGTEAVAAGFTWVVTDFERVTYLGEHFIGPLVHLLSKTLEQRGGLVICDLQPQIREVFDLFGYTRFFEIVPTRDDAVALLADEERRVATFGEHWERAEERRNRKPGPTASSSTKKTPATNRPRLGSRVRGPQRRARTITQAMYRDLWTVLLYLDMLLEKLPADQIEIFAQSEGFASYREVFEVFGLDEARTHGRQSAAGPDALPTRYLAPNNLLTVDPVELTREGTIRITEVLLDLRYFIGKLPEDDRAEFEASETGLRWQRVCREFDIE